PCSYETAISHCQLLSFPTRRSSDLVSRNYLDWLLAVPWKKKSKEIRNIDRAEKILNEDHYGLEKIKERILEFLAVRQLVKNPKGDRKSTRLNSSHRTISYAVFCLKK